MTGVQTCALPILLQSHQLQLQLLPPIALFPLSTVSRSRFTRGLSCSYFNLALERSPHSEGGFGGEIAPPGSSGRARGRGADTFRRKGGVLGWLLPVNPRRPRASGGRARRVDFDPGRARVPTSLSARGGARAAAAARAGPTRWPRPPPARLPRAFPRPSGRKAPGLPGTPN